MKYRVLVVVALLALLSFSAVGEAVDITLAGWSYRTDVVEQLVNEFIDRNPDINVEYLAVPSSQYPTRISTMVMAGDVPDVMYVRGENLTQWYESGWIQPIDDLIARDAPWIDEMYPSVREYMRIDNHWIGLPYYVGYQILIYNEELLNKAGISGPPKTLQEWEGQIKTLQDKGLVDYGYYPNWAQGEITVVRDFQVFNALFGGDPLLDENNNFEPTFDKPGAPARQALQWMVDAIHTKKIFPPDAATASERDAQNEFYAGRIPFYSGTFYVLNSIRDPKVSKVYDVARAALIPGAVPGVRSASALFSRAYGMGGKTKGAKREAAWKLIQFLGGKTNGEYHAAKVWTLASGLGYGWKPLEGDPEVQAAMDHQAKRETLNAQMANSFPQIRIERVIWYAEWQEYSKVELNKALLGTQSVDETLANMAAKARELQKRYNR